VTQIKSIQIKSNNNHQSNRMALFVFNQSIQNKQEKRWDKGERE